jgi:hypothetical protein
MPSIIDDVVEVIAITTIFSLPAVLIYPSMHVVVGQMTIATGQCCCFNLGSFYPIMRLVTTKGLISMVSNRWDHCDDVARCLNPLLG